MRKAIFVFLCLLLMVSMAAIPSGTVSARPASSPQPSASSPPQQEDEEALIADILKGLDEIDKLTENKNLDKKFGVEVRDCTWDAGVYIIRVKLALKKGDSKAARENKWAAFKAMDLAEAYSAEFYRRVLLEKEGYVVLEKDGYVASRPYAGVWLKVVEVCRTIMRLQRMEWHGVVAPRKVISPPTEPAETPTQKAIRTGIWNCTPKEDGTKADRPTEETAKEKVHRTVGLYKTERSTEGTPKERYDNLVGLYKDAYLEPPPYLGPLRPEHIEEDFEGVIIGDVSKVYEREQEKSLLSPDLHTLHPAPIFGYIILRSRFETEDHTCEGIIGWTIIHLHLSSTAPITIVESAAEASEYPCDIWGHVIINLKDMPVQRIEQGGAGGGC